MSPVDGVLFAATDGRRSSQAVGMATLADAVRTVDADLARDIDRCRGWRDGYVRHLVAVEAAAAQSAKAALLVAADGLAALHSRIVFRRDGVERPLRDAVRAGGPGRLGTTVIEGTGPRPETFELPYRGAVLTGDGLRRQLDRWVADGVVEASCAAAVTAVLDHPEWLDARDLRVGLIGAAAEMGPLATLSRWGATVLAVDVPRPELWDRIVGTARQGSGRLHLPTRPGGSGADLLTETPEVLAWLAAAEPTVVGNYAYADGGAFVRVAAAADAVIDELVERQPGCAVAYLASPTDAFAVPRALVDEVRTRVRRPTLRTLTGSRLYRPRYASTLRAEDGTEFGVADSVVPQQGPNYALAKRLQRWRAVLARENGTLSSANVAPATRTRSVLSNRVLRAAYAGAGAYGVEVFEPATSSTLMAALLLYDLRHPASPARPTVWLDHPSELFVHAAAHGGLWRLPYEPRSVLGLAVLRGLAPGRRR